MAPSGILFEFGSATSGGSSEMRAHFVEWPAALGPGNCDSLSLFSFLTLCTFLEFFAFAFVAVTTFCEVSLSTFLEFLAFALLFIV